MLKIYLSTSYQCGYLEHINDKIGNENSECRLAVMQKRTSIVYSLLKVIWID